MSAREGKADLAVTSADFRNWTQRRPRLVNFPLLRWAALRQS